MKNMLKLFLVNAIFLSLFYVSTPSILRAERTPDYKDEAYRRCVAECAKIFELPQLRDMCRLVCYIGIYGL